MTANIQVTILMSMKMVRDVSKFVTVLSIIATFVYFRTVNGQLYENHKFTRHQELQNHICPTQDIVMATTLDSSVLCAVTCTRVSACRSSAYKKDTKECVLCRGPYSTSSELLSADGYRFYSDITRNYHQGCTSNVDCNEPHNVCASTTGNVKLCLCNHGYSLHPGTMTCGPGCSSYGSSFEMYRQRYLDGLNDEIKDGVTLQFCKNYCASVTGYTCRSFERENNKCWFSSHNAITKPNAYGVWTQTQSDFYNRNCA